MERFYFFDRTDTEPREYRAADFARFHAQIVGNGVSNTETLADLAVESKQNMTVILGAGFMFANGYMYENTAAMDLTHDVAEPDADRIDRVIVRYDNDPVERKVYAYIKKGIPGASPKAPSITRDSYVFEMSVAQVRIIAGKSFIEQSEIIDERTDDAVCGYIPLHNIYRGIQINEVGMVSMPNQSFMKSRNDTPLQLTDSSKVVPLGTIETDKQGEVLDGNTFQAKADGIYHFWVEMAWPQDVGLAGVDVQVYLYVNGTESFPMAAKVFADTNDNFIIQSGVDELKKGDKVTVRAIAFRSGSLPATRFTRLRIAKMA